MGAMGEVFENPNLREEILLRVPADPKLHVRITAVCRGWQHHFADPGFLRRYRMLHGSPPMIGYLQNTNGPQQAEFASFVSITPGFSAHIPTNDMDLEVLDSHHGRVLLLQNGKDKERSFIVWDPVADHHQEVRMPESFTIPSRSHFTAAVFCDAWGLCDHQSCHRGPFRLLFVGFVDGFIGGHGKSSALVYTSEADVWTASSATAAIAYNHEREFGPGPAALVGSTMYFMTSGRILRYEFGSEAERLSYVDVPEAVMLNRNLMFGRVKIHGAVLVPSVDRTLSLAAMYRGRKASRIRFWEMAIAASGEVRWVEKATAKIPVARARLVGGGATSLFIRIPHNRVTHRVTCFDLGSGRLQNLPYIEMRGPVSTVLPFVSFYDPPPPGAAEAILAKSEATARGMRLVSEAMTTEGSAKAASPKLAGQDIEAFSNLAQKTNTMLLPGDSVSPASFVAQVMKTSQQIHSHSQALKSHPQIEELEESGEKSPAAPSSEVSNPPPLIEEADSDQIFTLQRPKNKK